MCYKAGRDFKCIPYTTLFFFLFYIPSACHTFVSEIKRERERAAELKMKNAKKNAIIQAKCALAPSIY